MSALPGVWGVLVDPLVCEVEGGSSEMISWLLSLPSSRHATLCSFLIHSIRDSSMSVRFQRGIHITYARQVSSKDYETNARPVVKTVKLTWCFSLLISSLILEFVTITHSV
jgi:hypothetical protein